MKTLEICTLANNHAQYANMRRTFLSAGFDEERCSYRLFDNSAGNRYDPYDTINAVLNEIEALAIGDRPRCVIFCHQDVYADQGDGFDRLMTVLDELDRLDARWAVAGNAGVNPRLEVVRHYAAPTGGVVDWPMPRRTLTLDENLLIIKVGTGIRCSPGLSGFHWYGTDLCLSALTNRCTVYVVGFCVTHEGLGTIDEVFYGVQRKMQAAWNRRFICAILASPCNTFGLSRFALIRRVVNSGRATNFAKGHPRLTAFLMALNRPFCVRARA